MIGAYIHVNGIPLDILNIQNMEHLDNDIMEGKCLYRVKTVGKTFEVKHKRKDGWKKLFIKVLKKLSDED